MLKTHEEKGIATMTVILIIVGALVIAFTVTMIVIFIQTGAIPDTLCTCFFAAATGEFGVMGWIRTTKDRKRERKFEIEDREYQKQESERSMNDE